MNRGKCFLRSLKLVNSLCLQSILPQVITPRFSYLSPHLSLSSKPIGDHSFPSFHQRSLFSSTSDLVSIVDALSSNKWSEEIETMLMTSGITWTPEVCIYILRNLEYDSAKATSFYRWVRTQDGFRRTETVTNLYLRALALGVGPLSHFWAVYDLYRLRGINLNGETYKEILNHFRAEKNTLDARRITQEYIMMVNKKPEETLVMLMATMIKVSEWNNSIEDDIGRIKVSFSDDSISLVLKELRKEPSKALRFFRWVNQRHKYAHSSTTYNSLARVLGKKESIVEFWDIVSEMKAFGYNIDFDTYIKILKAFIVSETMEDAVNLFIHMMDGPYKPRIENCVFLLSGLSENPTHLDLVYRVAKKYEESGHSLSKEAYDQIHKSLSGAGKFEDARKIRNTMENIGCTPDNNTFGPLVCELCKLMKLQEAFAVLAEMERFGCAANTQTWTTLIQGCFAANDVQRALDYFTKMLARGCHADAFLLEVLVKGFLKHDKVSAAHVLILEIVDMGNVVPFHRTYKAVIEKIIGQGKLEEGMELLRMMIKHNHPPFPGPFDKYIAKCGSVREASEYLTLITSKGKKKSLPFCRIFRCLFEEGREAEARELLKECPPNVQQCGAVHKIFRASKRQVIS